MIKQDNLYLMKLFLQLFIIYYQINRISDYFQKHQMNLNAIVQSMNRLKLKQNRIKQYYSLHKISCYMHKQELKRNIQDDQKNFGLSSYNKGYFNSQFLQSRAQTAPIKNRSVYTPSVQNSIKRSASTSYVRKYIPQNNNKIKFKNTHQTFFLTPPTYDKQKHPCKSISVQSKKYLWLNEKFPNNNKNNISNRLSSAIDSMKIKRQQNLMTKKTIKKYKNNLKKSFELNIETLKSIRKKQTMSTKSKTIVYDHQFVKKPEQFTKSKLLTVGIFNLTSQQQMLQCKDLMKSNLQLLRQFGFTLSMQPNMPSIDKRKIGIHKWDAIWKLCNLKNIPKYFTVLLIQTKGLKMMMLQCVSNNKQCYFMLDGKFIDLQKAIKIILNKYPKEFLHIYFINGKNLFHEEFLMNSNMLVHQSKNNQHVLLEYYFKRFLALDPECNDQEQIFNYTTQMLTKSRSQCPKQFKHFIQSLPIKDIYFFDRNWKLLHISLKKILMKSLEYQEKMFLKKKYIL